MGLGSPAPLLVGTTRTPMSLVVATRTGGTKTDLEDRCPRQKPHGRAPRRLMENLAPRDARFAPKATVVIIIGSLGTLPA